MPLEKVIEDDLEPFLAVIVPRRSGEPIRKELQNLGLTDPSRKIKEKGELVEIPVKGIPRAYKDRFEMVVQEDPTFRKDTQDPIERIEAKIDLDPALKPHLPKRWELIGDILTLKIPPRLKPHAHSVAKAYADVLKVRAVLEDMGIEGELREPNVRHLWGSKETETVHLENKVRYILDPAKVMFSSGNMDERIRMATIPKEGEVVVDMFAGIGYFTIPMAFHSNPSKILALEKNKTAFEFLLRNCELNKVQGKVEPVLGDNRDAPEKVADRVIMGYLPSPKEFLPKAIKILKRNKKCVIHYHENALEAEIPGALFSRVAGAAGVIGRGAKMIGHKWIKSYAPRVWHAVVDVEII